MQSSELKAMSLGSCGPATDSTRLLFPQARGSQKSTGLQSATESTMHLHQWRRKRYLVGELSFSSVGKDTG